MTELRGFDLDGETSRAWRAFAGRLADHLADMEDGDTLGIGLVGLPSEAPGAESSEVTFIGCEDTLVRADVMVAAPAVPERVDDREPGSGLADLLSQLGWVDQDAPGTGGSADTGVLRARQEVPRREADHLASLTVRLLCEVLGAVHPVFLRVRGDHDLVDRSPEGNTISDVRDLEPPGVTEPVDSAHLRELVTRTISADLGTDPPRDDDGDIALDAGTSRVYVRVLEQSPVIQVFGRLVRKVSRPFEAPLVVARLNADYSFVKFIFGGGSVVACVHLPANPFVPAQLRRMIATFAELANYLDDELVRRLGGLRELEPDPVEPDPGQPKPGQPEPGQPQPGPVDPADEILGEQDWYEEDSDEEPDGVPPELLTLLRLDPEGVGLDPELTAKICGYDKALTWQLLHIAGGQETVWREAAEQEGEDPDQEAKCVDEAAGWKATRRSLARALELITSSDD